jgi:HD superfamily phosphohydrolase
MRVAERWYDHLFPNSKGSAEREFLSASMLLHDYGHLPFSHLFEEIFDELHWLPAERSGRPWHEVLTEQKIPELFSSTIPGTQTPFAAHLRELGYAYDDVLFLIEGHSGRPYLDAIVNSAIDADKIDYIFRDIRFLQFGSSLPPDPKG